MPAYVRREKPHCFREFARRGQHCRTVPTREYCYEPQYSWLKEFFEVLLETFLPTVIPTAVLITRARIRQGQTVTISFKGAHFPKDVILHSVFFYLRYGVSYRGLEEVMAERGVDLNHATLNRWVGKYAVLVAEAARYRKRAADRSWRMDETYIRVRGKWMYLYRAVDKAGHTLEFMLSERKNGPAAPRFFAKALSSNGIPNKIVIDKSGANTAGIREMNRILRRFGSQAKVQTIRSKYLNNIVEQDHRFIKRRVRPMCGFKSFTSGSATLEGIEVANMIRKHQFPTATVSGFRMFAEIAG